MATAGPEPPGGGREGVGGRAGPAGSDPGRRARIEAVFEEALTRPPAGRAAFVREAPGLDPEGRAAVLRLLRAHERAGGILDEESALSAAALLDTGGGEEESPTPPVREERIGPYRIREELGRGGMGVVYLAERDDGQFRHRVAVKVIRATGDETLEARVLAERQILASLDHPSIARLVDAGTTGDGRFFLVMELVDGLPLDVYCDRMRLPVADRLRLFLQVAEVVEHAHRNLVVHRDLKPSNILVTPEGRVKLLDFGIAKLLNPSLAGVRAPVTRRGSLVLTPCYASPEQLRGEALTTGTDVYSLGVILYELLTGHLPHEPRGTSPAAQLESMAGGDPPRPSVRVRRSSDPRHGEARGGAEDGGGPGAGEGRPASPEAVAAARGTTPDRLARALRGDLDAIVLRAVRMEPPLRYGSAESLARDVERHLAGEPVSAQGDSRSYRLRTFLRRHTVESVAAVAVVLALVVGFAATAWQARVAGRERDRAARALLQAEAALAQSEEVADFLLELFQAGDPLVGEGPRITAQDLVQRGIRRADGLEEQPVVQARMLDVLGRIQDHFGAYEEADRLLERAVELRRRELGPTHPELAVSLVNLARARRDLGRRAEARALVEEALAIRRGLPGPDPGLAEAVFEKGWLAEGAEQEALYREALRLHRDAGGDPGGRAAMLEALATNLRRQGRLPHAVATARDALALTRETFGRDDPRTAVAMYHLADHLRDVEQDYEEAARLYRSGIDIQTRAYGAVSLQLIHGVHALGVLHMRAGELEQAEAHFRQALSIREQATGPDNPALATSMDAVAAVLGLQGRLAEAEAMVRRALDHRDRTQGLGHEERQRSLAELGTILARAGRWDEARDAFEEAFSLRMRAGGTDDIVLAELRRRWGRILVGSGRFSEAEPPLLAALEGLEAVYLPEHPNRVDARRALHELYTAWGRPGEAEAYRVPDGVFHPY